MKSKIWLNIKKFAKNWLKVLLIALFLALFIRTFIVQSFVVSSNTMAKTLQKGDYVFVNKLKYGARLPITILSLPFSQEFYSTLIKMPYKRLPGYGEVGRNDLLAFNNPILFDPPIDKKTMLLKRCVGLPGDTIKVYNKKLYVNNKVFPTPKNVLFNYRLVTNGSLLDNNFVNKYEIVNGGLVSDIGIYDFSLKEEQVEEITKSEERVDVIRETKNYPGNQSQEVFPIGRKYNFSKDFFGEVIVPYKGMKVKLNFKTIEQFADIIEIYEGNKLEQRNNSIYINGEKTKYYTIKSNYYFVMDDNRDYAKDSRYIGYIPESYIVGKAGFCWYSFDTQKNKIRWKRILKSLK